MVAKPDSDDSAHTWAHARAGNDAEGHGVEEIFGDGGAATFGEKADGGHVWRWFLISGS